MPSNNLTPYQESETHQSHISPVRRLSLLNWLPRFLILLLGVGVIVWAFFNPRFRNIEGYASGTICLPISVGIAFLIMGVAINTRFAKSGFWFSLALIGQAVALQMVFAGSNLHYQHYRPISELLEGFGSILLIFIALQTLLVIIGYRNRWRILRNWIKNNFKLWQIISIGSVMILSSVAVSQSVPIYITELIFASFVGIVNLGTIILAVWEIPDSLLRTAKIRMETIFGSSGKSVPENRKSRLVDRFVVIATIWVILFSALLNIVSYERHPHLADEVAYLIQANFFAEGKLTMIAPPDKEAFELYLMQFDGARWYPSTPPGWPAMLAVGVFLGVPWLVNPLLAGINVLLIYVLLQKLYSRWLARVGVFLLCLSPWFIFMGMNFMTHTFLLMCALIATLCVLQSRQSGKARWAVIGGIALGVMSWIRPLEALMMAVLLGLWSVGLGGQRLKFKAIAVLVLSSGIVASFILPYNNYLTGDARVFPINAYTNQQFGTNSNAYGFGPDRGMGWPIDPNPGHSPLDAMINADLNLFSINIELFGWSIGSILLAALFLLTGPNKTSDYLLVSIIIGIFGIYFFYYFSGGPDFGARYWYLMIVPLVALTVRGIQFLESKIAGAQPEFSAAGTRALLGVIFLSLIALVNFIPWRAIDKYHNYLDMRPDIRYLARDYGFGRSLILIRGDQLPDYASAAAYNPVDFNTDKPIYVWDRGLESRSKAVSSFPDRPVWVVDGPTITGRGFEVVAGPFSSQLVLSGISLP